MEQLQFPGLPPARKQRDRLFLAIRPPRETAVHLFRRAHHWRTRLDLDGPPQAASRLHLTLWAFEPRVGVPKFLVERIGQIASQLDVAPFDVRFDAVGSFTGKPFDRPFVLLGERDDLSALHAFQRRLVDGLIAKHLMPARFAGLFTPHITLLYDDKAIPHAKISGIGWTVRDFVLIRSRVGYARHDELGRWALHG